MSKITDLLRVERCRHFQPIYLDLCSRVNKLNTEGKHRLQISPQITDYPNAWNNIRIGYIKRANMQMQLIELYLENPNLREPSWEIYILALLQGKLHLGTLSGFEILHETYFQLKARG